MLVALVASACFWNIATWWFGIPNSSSHCIIGALIGVSIGNALLISRPLDVSVDWSQVWSVLRALAVSPVLGLVLAGGLYLTISTLFRTGALFQQTTEDWPASMRVRALLILTCGAVSFSHGTNDGQKSIGLIMLTFIGLFPTAYALGPNSRHDIAEFSRKAAPAGALIQKFGDDEKDLALRSLENLQRLGHVTDSRYAVRVVSDRPNGAINPAAAKQASMRNDIYRVLSEMKNVESSEQASVREKKTAGELRSTLRGSVEYAPFWVRLASALCLGIGTMFGYRRVVRTLGERLGRTQLTPAKGASAELVSALLIGTAGFSGLPVSTTHVVTSGIAGTMLMDRGKPGLRQGTVSRILLAWVLTLPVTIGIAAILFYVLER
jgi:PiT family inorganic phosphate transporter